jgi:hypothetical protein
MVVRLITQNLGSAWRGCIEPFYQMFRSGRTFLNDSPFSFS